MCPVVRVNFTSNKIRERTNGNPPLPAAVVSRGIGRHDQTHQSKIESIKPDQQDFDAVEKEYGPLPPNPSQAAPAERYRLAQAAKVIRQLEQVAIGGKTKNRKSKQ